MGTGMIRRSLASLGRWRSDTSAIWVLGWLAAIVVLSGAVAIGLRATRAVLPIVTTAAGENAFLAVMILGLAVLVASIRWSPPLGRRGRWLIFLFGVVCSAASLCFGIKGLALVVLVSATVDLALAAASKTEPPL